MRKPIMPILLFLPSLIYSQEPALPGFDDLINDKRWELRLEDRGTDNWHSNWFLDGEVAEVENTDKGMHLQAGPEFGNDAHHMVLWTKQIFNGDVKIEFDYIRTDEEHRAVNILYIQATGKQEGEFVKDISEWNHLRTVPSMRTYFNNINTLHISFAAFPNDGISQDYIRVRRYPVLPDKNFRELEVEPTFFDTGLFKTGITYHITVVKTNPLLVVEVTGDDKTKKYYWETAHLPPLTEGRIGLRHMYTRSALYRNFKVFTR